MIQCRLCHSDITQSAFVFHDHPIVHHLKDSASSNNSFLGTFELFECQSCGFLFADDYFAPQTLLYENYITLSSSKPQIHAQRVVDTLGYFVNVSAPRIFEIGCNDGSFIKLLQASGYQHISAIEPAKDAFSFATRIATEVYNDYFSAQFVERNLSHHYYDVVVTRQVLEHISDLHDFLAGVHLMLSRDGLFIIEVPDHSMNYNYCDYSFWEEHINYFTLNTLRQLLAMHGFDIFYYETALFSGQALIVYCKPSPDMRYSDVTDSDRELRDKYIRNFPLFRTAFNNFLQDTLRSHREIYVYGAGCRSLCLVDFLESHDLITAFVDDSTDKVMTYTPGRSLPIIPYDAANKSAYFLLAVNAEIESELLTHRSIDTAHASSILPPSNRLPYFWTKNFYHLAT